MPTEKTPDPTEICRQEDFRHNPDRYMGLTPDIRVRCVGRFGLSNAMCTMKFAIDGSLVDDTFEVTELADPLGCQKARQGEKSEESINPKYL